MALDWVDGRSDEEKTAQPLVEPQKKPFDLYLDIQQYRDPMMSSSIVQIALANKEGTILGKDDFKITDELLNREERLVSEYIQSEVDRVTYNLGQKIVGKGKFKIHKHY